jgi:hypothetical protein
MKVKRRHKYLLGVEPRVIGVWPGMRTPSRDLIDEKELIAALILGDVTRHLTDLKGSFGIPTSTCAIENYVDVTVPTRPPF